jgi:pectate lyase
MKNLFLMLLSLFVLPFSIQASTYYLDADNGNDNNDGISTQTSWKSLAKISTTALSPGDIICFKKGNRFNGHFVVNGSGSSLNPITITAYGSGAKPIITGEVGAAGGGDYQEAIYIMNQDNIIIDGLEINNERLATRSGIDDKTAFGIYIYNSGTQIMRNFIIRNMTFQNVYATQPMLLPEDFNNLEVAAVRFYTTKNTVSNQVKNIQNVLVENCYFTDLQRLGVHIKHAGGNTGIGTDSSNRNRDFIFRNNNFDHIGGTCILPSMTYNCLIENNIFNYPGDNSDPRMPNRSRECEYFYTIQLYGRLRRWFCRDSWRECQCSVSF